jgi:hypothetical protein
LFTTLLAGASMLALALEQVPERRQQLAAQFAVGAPRSMLARSLLWRAAIPVLVVVGGAVGVGSAMAWLVLSFNAVPFPPAPTTICCLSDPGSGSQVRHRTKVTKGPGSRAAGLAMAFKPIESAQARWRAVNAPHLVALVRAGASFRQRRPRRTT